MKNSKVAYVCFGFARQHNKAMKDIINTAPLGDIFIIPHDVNFAGLPTTVQEGEKL